MNENFAKPFVKWAAVKKQILFEIDKLIPVEFKSSNFRFIEPFVGGGGFLFCIVQKYLQLNKVVINDTNSDLINSYNIIKNNVDKLIMC
jgi:DNA adenine methylase